MIRPAEIAAQAGRQQAQKWQVVGSALSGWGRTSRLALLLLIMQIPEGLLVWLSVRG
jgi:hypothetical protein